MTRHDDLRLLDPVDRAAPTPDGDQLLREILAVPVPDARRRVPHVRVGVVAGAGLAAAGVALAVPHGGSGDLLADAYAAVHQPGTILHYTSVIHSPGDAAGGELEMEVWQAADGSRQRVLTRAPGLGLNEAVVDGQRSETYVEDSNEIFVYEEKAPAPDAPGAVGAPAMGDPTTLLERAQDPGTTVEELGEAQVRGVDVLQFRVGECRVHIERSGGGVAMRYRSPLIVSIAKDDSMPVRVDQPSCRATADDGTPGVEVPAGPSIDYVGLEVLDATPAHEHQLDMAPHPGAARRDGEDIDAAEERADRGKGGVTMVPEPALHPPGEPGSPY
jgi:hypothetical protein